MSKLADWLKPSKELQRFRITSRSQHQAPLEKCSFFRESSIASERGHMLFDDFQIPFLQRVPGLFKLCARQLGAPSQDAQRDHRDDGQNGDAGSPMFEVRGHGDSCRNPASRAEVTDVGTWPPTSPRVCGA